MQSSDVASISPVSSLPLDCTFLIFDSLTDRDWRNCRRVCKQWRQVLQRPYYRERIERLAISCLYRSHKIGVVCGTINESASMTRLLHSADGTPSILRILTQERVEIHSFPSGYLIFKGKYCGYHKASDRHFFERLRKGDRCFWKAKSPIHLIPCQEENDLELELREKWEEVKDWAIGPFQLRERTIRYLGEVIEGGTLFCQHMRGLETCSFPVGNVFRQIFKMGPRVDVQVCDVQLNGSWLHVLAKGPVSMSQEANSRPLFNYSIIGFPLLSS